MNGGGDPGTEVMRMTGLEKAIAGIATAADLKGRFDDAEEPLCPDHVPGSGHGRTGEEEAEAQIVFSPPVGIQRYLKVSEVLREALEKEPNQSPKSILEVGCAGLKLHTYMKRLHPSVEKLVYMDIDEQVIKSTHREQLSPLLYEHLVKRETPLRVEAYAGDITKCDDRILNLEPKLYAVVGIEIIEHLHPNVLLGFEKTVFGVLSPFLILVTTPNYDFNSVFNLKPGTFRHWDHKFEWTRPEFVDWCKKVCLEYPGYSFETIGIGAGGEGTESLGCVSQMAVFRKNETIIENTALDLSGIVQENCYKLIAEIDYPFYVDPAPKEERVLREFKYYITQYVLNYTSVRNYLEEELTEVRVSLERAAQVHGMPKDLTGPEELRTILENGGYVLELNEDGSDYDIILQVPEEEDRWPESEDEDEQEPGNINDSGIVEGENNGVESRLPESEEDWE